MKNRGFTLIEMLGVMIILTFLAFIVSEVIINNINDTNSKLEKLANDILISSARDYVSKNEFEFEKKINNSYCISYRSLVVGGFIKDEMLPKIKNIKDIDSRSVSVSYNGSLFEYNVLTNGCEYNVSYELRNVQVNKTITSLKVGEKVELIVTANSNYELPEKVVVKGADYTWDKSTGKLVLTYIYNNVVISVQGVSLVDATKPILTIDPKDGIFKSSVNITVTVRDDESGLSDNNKYQYCLSKNNSSPTDCTWNDYVSGTPFEITGDNDTYYLWIYPIEDNYGNVNGDNINLNPYVVGTYKFDSIAPTLDIITSASNCSQTTAVTISISDSGTGLSDENKYQYYLSTSNTSLENGSFQTYKSGSSFSFNTDINNYTPGTYYLWIYPIKDNVGNVTNNVEFGNPYNAKTITLKYEKCFSYNGGSQTFTVPHAGNYKVEAWGAQGSGNDGGKGGYTKGNIDMSKSEVFYVYVGGQNGYNGGGAGCSSTLTGGGATDLRLISGAWNDSKSLNSRIMIAGGGGGNNYDIVTPGHGGGLSGTTGIPNGNYTAYTSTGGTQTSGGIVNNHGASYTPGTNGSYAKGGTGGCDSGAYGGSYGGGGGLYGGAGGSRLYGGQWSGGGGSSYISGHTGCVAVTSQTSSTPKSGCSNGTTDISCSYHYSGKKFTSTQTITGNNTMPNTTTGTSVGHLGDGYLKITYLNS